MPTPLVIGVIPARYASTRFPGKPLAMIAGRPMIQWVYEQSSKAKSLGRVLVATDDDRIAAAVQAFGGTAVLTSPRHACGTDRLAEVAAAFPDVDLVVNIQGDEPLIAPDAIDLAVRSLQEHPEAAIGTLVAAASRDDMANPNVVKVVLDSTGRALYFSRSPIPYQRSPDGGAPNWKHIGLYAYRREFLIRFSKSPSTPLEQTESLEQLRALEMGERIICVESPYDSISVDSIEDIVKVESALGIRPAA